MMPDDTHEKMLDEWMQDATFKAEYERVEREEIPLLDSILKASQKRSEWH